MNHSKRNVEKCPNCKRRFRGASLPLVSVAFIDGGQKEMCPLCYGVAVRRIHGIRWEPQGEIAAMMLAEAKRTMIRGKRWPF